MPNDKKKDLKKIKSHVNKNIETKNNKKETLD